ncbi:hypothetical protein SI65_04965 [Aspergillus cristatus]|uniref:Uncharacterized protein n=1 Tax=Aspergillus cristatus TaxID=573508 RepID=A0A1E3BGC5_ASPCR|nr:hypothetical protein SI65_04965 [Aspergillus cristatus]
MALRQMNSYQPKPWSRTRRQTISSTRNNPSGTPQSQRPVSQPVLVRTYTGNTGENIINNNNHHHHNNNKPPEPAKNPSTPSPRRLSFPFLSIPSSPPQNKTTGPKLPPPEAFSIESILTAIDPSIQGTLTSIAKIYGCSKLSLANEYGSHIAPLGEIRAPPGYLLTVDEASSEQERQQDETDNGGVDSCYMSFAPFSVTGDRSSVQAQPDTPRSTTETNLGFELDAGFGGPATREFAEGDGVCGRGLLGEDGEQRVVTPAVVSEVHLDAQADQVLESGAGDDGSGSLSLLGGLQSFFNRVTQYGQARTCRQSAEVQLRAMLHRDLPAE